MTSLTALQTVVSFFLSLTIAIGQHSFAFAADLPQPPTPMKDLAQALTSHTLATLTTHNWDAIASDKNYLRTLAGEAFSEHGWRAADLAVTTGTVKQLTPNGPICLVYGIESGGQIGVSVIVIIYKHGARTFSQAFDTIYGNIAEDVGPRGEAGTLSVLTRMYLAWSTSRVNAVVWPDVFVYRDGRFVKADSEVPQIYRDFLKNVDDRILLVDEQNRDPQSDLFRFGRMGREEVFLRMRSDLLTGHYMAQNVLGDAKAGLEQGLTWASDKRVFLRRLAVPLLSSQEDPSAITSLKTLAADQDPEIARMADRSLNPRTHPEFRHD